MDRGVEHCDVRLYRCELESKPYRCCIGYANIIMGLVCHVSELFYMGVKLI